MKSMIKNFFLICCIILYANCIDAEDPNSLEAYEAGIINYTYCDETRPRGWQDEYVQYASWCERHDGWDSCTWEENTYTEYCVLQTCFHEWRFDWVTCTWEFYDKECFW